MGDVCYKCEFEFRLKVSKMFLCKYLKWIEKIVTERSLRWVKNWQNLTSVGVDFTISALSW